MLLTVVRNLLSNAIKYSEKGGNITVNLTNEDKNAIVSVKDTGVGISEDNIQRLFKVNGNYKTHGTNNEEGTGLGLILCKEFLLKNDGDIYIKSELGKGTKASFTIPLA
jgi:two-component system sensor histidine kinase/response regulator